MRWQKAMCAIALFACALALFQYAAQRLAATGRWAFEASTGFNLKCLYEDTNVY